MNLALTNQQREIATSTRAFLAKELAPARIRELARHPSGPSIDAGTWEHTASLGWLGLGLPEALGGSTLGAFEEVLLFGELGRAVAPGPYLGTVLAGHASADAGTVELAAALVAGKRRSGLRVGDLVLDATAGELALDLDGPVVSVREIVTTDRLPSMDPGVPTSRAVFGPVLVHVEAPTIVARARLLVAAMLLGLIESVRDMSRTYALERIQFGRPIGAFQAVKHRCADMEIAAQAARAQVLFAAHRLDARQADAGFHAAAALLVAVRGMRRATANNIQNHGAIGFTVEHDAHLYARRGLVLERALGPLGDAMRDVLAPERHEFG